MSNNAIICALFNIKTFTELLTHAREEAIQRMVEEAEKMDADAIIGARFVSANIIQNVTEILAYGTAVKFEK